MEDSKKCMFNLRIRLTKRLYITQTDSSTIRQVCNILKKCLFFAMIFISLFSEGVGGFIEVSGANKAEVAGTYFISDEKAASAPNDPVWKLADGNNCYIINPGYEGDGELVLKLA